MTEEIIIYWSPNIRASKFSANLLFPKPESLASIIHRDKVPGSALLQCPANKDAMKNIFVMKAGVDDTITFPEGYLDTIASNGMDGLPMKLKSVAEMLKARDTTFEGYTNVVYNLQWLVFSSEPVMMRLTAPWYPATSPCEGSLFSFGQMDVGRWFRTLNLDYHIPNDTKEFVVKEGDALAYMEFDTDKKIVFKRFSLSDELFNISEEMAFVSVNYNKNKSIQSRYEMAEKSEMRELILHHIKKNLVESAG